MRKGWGAALLTAGFTFCVGGVVLNHHATANVDRQERTIKSITDQDVRNVFTSDGIKRETHAARVFIIKRGDPGGAIEGFKAAGGDKIRIDGFGLTKAEAVKALMHQQDRDTILALPDGPVIELLDTQLDSLREDTFQLELDRSNLVETFADDFNSFSWYSEGSVAAKRPPWELANALRLASDQWRGQPVSSWRIASLRRCRVQGNKRESSGT